MGKDWILCDDCNIYEGLPDYICINKPARQMAHVKLFIVFIVFRTVNSTTIGAATRIAIVNRGWKDRGGEKEIRIIFFPEHSINFILTSVITQLEVQWGARAKEPGEDNWPMSCFEKEASHSDSQRSPVKKSKPDSDREEEDDHEVLFPPRKQDTIIIPSSPGKVLEVPDCDVATMVKTLNGTIAAVSRDTARIQRAYQQLCTDNITRDRALANLTAMVREYGSSPAATQPYGPPTPTGRPRPTMQADVLDADGNLRAADIGITWEDNETFLHGVRVVGSKFSRPTGQEPVMSTPYPRGENDDRSSSP